jgi:UDP-N-acetylmuramoyl-tripeptide--D-alanyl-D-alanine ligase
MKHLSITDLTKIINARASRQNGKIAAVCTDSRSVKPGDCFFAIRGENFDGHNFVAQALAKGAVCAVIDRPITLPDVDKTQLLQVDDTVNALGRLAAHYRTECAFKVIAITGSVGKTTTRHIVYHVLSKHFRCRQSPKNFNNNIGLPLTLLAADPDDQMIVAEIATNHPGEVAYLTQIARPDIAVITNVNPVHLEGLENLQNITEEKLSITQGLMPDGILIINADCRPLFHACREKQFSFLSFGTSGDADIRASNITFSQSASRFTIGGMEVSVPLLGRGNIENALAAWAVCSCLNINIGDFANALKTLSPVPMRTEVLQIGGLTVLNDCYNANPASMKNALNILAGLDPDGKRRLVFVCGDMAELGAQTEKLHAELGALIAQTGVRLLLTIGKHAEIAAKTAKHAAGPKLHTESFDNALCACNCLQNYIKDSDIILVKGSRTAKLESVVEKLKEIFLKSKEGFTVSL